MELETGTHTFQAIDLVDAFQQLAPGHRMELTAVNGAEVNFNLLEDVTREPASDGIDEAAVLAIWFNSDMVEIRIFDGSNVTVEVRQN